MYLICCVSVWLASWGVSLFCECSGSHCSACGAEYVPGSMCHDNTLVYLLLVRSWLSTTVPALKMIFQPFTCTFNASSDCRRTRQSRDNRNRRMKKGYVWTIACDVTIAKCTGSLSQHSLYKMSFHALTITTTSLVVPSLHPLVQRCVSFGPPKCTRSV